MHMDAVSRDTVWAVYLAVVAIAAVVIHLRSRSYLSAVTWAGAGAGTFFIVLTAIYEHRLDVGLLPAFPGMFVLGAVMAAVLGIPFVLARKWKRRNRRNEGAM